MSSTTTKRKTEFIEEQPAAKTSKKDSMFSRPWRNSDAVLIVESKEMHVHSMVLSLASEYFQKMFNGNFKEAETKRIILKGKPYELIDHMLRLIYPLKTTLGKTIHHYTSCNS